MRSNLSEKLVSNAKTIMSDKVVTVPASMDIQEAVEIFLNRKFTSVPVTTATGELAGQLTEVALIRLLVLSKEQPAKYKKLAHCLEHLEKPVFVEPNDSIPLVLKSILQSQTKRVFVSMDQNKIHGIISPKDLLKALSQNDKTAAEIQTALETK